MPVPLGAWNLNTTNTPLGAKYYCKLFERFLARRGPEGGGGRNAMHEGALCADVQTCVESSPFSGPHNPSTGGTSSVTFAEQMGCHFNVVFNGQGPWGLCTHGRTPG